MNPEISVLLPVRNGGDFILPALASLSAQTFREFEVVVVDDASSDETGELLSGYEDPRVRVHRMESPSGVAKCLQVGLQRCAAPLVARFDADDLCRQDRLARQAEVLHGRPDLGAVGSAAELIEASGQPIGLRTVPTGTSDVTRRLRWRNALIHSSVMFRRRLVDEVGGYREDAGQFEDYDLWLRLATVADIDNIGDPLISYRIHSGQVTRSRIGTRTGKRTVGESRVSYARDRHESRTAARARQWVWWMGQRLR